MPYLDSNATAVCLVLLCFAWYSVSQMRVKNKSTGFELVLC